MSTDTEVMGPDTDEVEAQCEESEVETVEDEIEEESETDETEAECEDEDKGSGSEAAKLDPAAKQELEHYEEIRDLNRRVMSSFSEWQELKDETSGAKKEFDRLSDKLRELINRGPSQQPQLLFGSDGQNDISLVRVDHEGDQAESSDAWRDVSVVDALALSVGQYEKLEEAGVKTVGQLEDLRGGEGLNSISGFGPATVDKIEDQIIDWLTDNRDKFGEVIDEDEGGIEGDDEAEEEPDQSDDDVDNQDDSSADDASNSDINADLDEL